MGTDYLGLDPSTLGGEVWTLGSDQPLDSTKYGSQGASQASQKKHISIRRRQVLGPGPFPRILIGEVDEPVEEG